MSQAAAPICQEGGGASVKKERKRTAQREWWEREGKARRAAQQEVQRTDSQPDLQEQVDTVSGYPGGLQSRLGFAEEEHVRAIIRQMSAPKEASMTNILLPSAAAALGLKYKQQIGSFLGQQSENVVSSTGQQSPAPPASPLPASPLPVEP